MAKNKKNKQKPQQQQQKPAAPKQQIVTQEIYDDGQSALDESGTVLNAVPETEVNVAEIEAAYVTDGSVTSEDVVKLTADLRKSTKIMNATQKAYETLKETYKNAEKQAKTLIDDATAEASKIKEDAQAEADALTEDAVSKADAVKEELAEKRNELNQRELKLIEDESAAKSGDHSAVIDRLIKAFKNSKEQVIVAAETQLQEQADVANEYIEKLGAITAKESQLEIKEKELETREKKIKAMEVVIEEEREELRDEIEKKIKDEYDERLEDAIEEANRYKNKMTKLNEDVNSLKDTLAIIRSAFGEVEPAEMADVCNKQKAEIENSQKN
jgi:vacuolar-type H+-ATPase subunit H